MIKKVSNKEISGKMDEIAKLLDIKGDHLYRIRAYKKASEVILSLNDSIADIYNENGLKGIVKIKGIGKSIALKIEEYIKKGKIKYLEDLKEETKIRQVVTHYFETKGIGLNQLKTSSKKREIIYSRYTKPAKQLIELAGSVANANKAIDKVALWANSYKLDYTIETVFKRWLELDRLKPKELVKKPYYNGNPLIWSKNKKKWFVIDETNTWLEFADTEDKIEWREE